MNPNEWTLDQCRDFLAECKGFRKAFAPSGSFAFWQFFQDSTLPDHPIPQTIDAIAGALPEGWYWRGINQYSDGWYVVAHKRSASLSVTQVESELLARARAACMAWIEHKKGTTQC